MALISASSPHVRRSGGTGAFMRQVIYATIPGAVVLFYFFGWGIVINLVVAVITALVSESLILLLRKRSLAFFLGDYSAILTAVLLALAVPPSVPWWLLVVGTGFAIIFGKQLYGGLGSNPFNPAMLGYVLLLISFPVQMTAWLLPAGIAEHHMTFTQSLMMAFDPGQLALPVDGYTMATPLDTFKTYAGNEPQLLSMSVLQGQLAGVGWEWVNAGFLLGGLYLMVRRIISWHVPVTVLLGLAVPAAIFHFIDPLKYASAHFYLFSGATMLGAFFIATDPVTGATSFKGRLIFGALVGFLSFVIRAWGGYPDGIAFAVLLMNLAAPTLDYYTQPRTYGHQQPNRGLADK